MTLRLAGEGGFLKEVRVDQSENSPTILVSNSGWALASESTISSEDGVAKNFKARSYQLKERKEQSLTHQDEERLPEFH